MIRFEGKGVLLDIEGTTSSISFVFDVMFPYVRRELHAYLQESWDDAPLRAARDQIARDAGHESFAAWSKEEDERSLLEREVLRLMDGDVKATGLKQLQGMIFERGFESGELRAHVYDDVPVALLAWRAAGRDVRIYSSGSIKAQKLFFGHTVAGDLLQHICGHYDTTTGPKKVARSYALIAKEFKLAPKDILFLSDVVAELDAAREAGLQTALCLRPGNAEVPAHSHPVIERFNEVELG